LRSDLYRTPIKGIELLKGAAPTHLELNRQCATELPGTIPNVRERRKLVSICFPRLLAKARTLPTKWLRQYGTEFAPAKNELLHFNRARDACSLPVRLNSNTIYSVEFAEFLEI
jgi:hypothetical protein